MNAIKPRVQYTASSAELDFLPPGLDAVAALHLGTKDLEIDITFLIDRALLDKLTSRIASRPMPSRHP